MAVLLRGAARRIFLEMDVERLEQAVLRLDVMAAEMLRATVQLALLAFDHTRHRTEPFQLIGEAVGPGNGANEHPLLIRIVLALAHFRSFPACRARRHSTRRTGDGVTTLLTPFAAAT